MSACASNSLEEHVSKKTARIAVPMIKSLVLALALQGVGLGCQTIHSSSGSSGSCNWSNEQVYCDNGSYCDISITTCEWATGFSYTVSTFCT